jgi:multicomponent Na+:H+ antiporter subunit A
MASSDEHCDGPGASVWRFAPAAASGAAFAWFIGFGPQVAAGEAAGFSRPWLPAFGIDLAFRLDGLSFAFALLATGIGALVFLYAAEYFRRDPRLWRLLATLAAFEIAMLGLVTADEVITLFVFWEGTTVASYLLVGFDHHKAEARARALQALLVTGLGGLALLAGLILLGEAAGSQRLSEMALARGTIAAHPDYALILGLILIGCFAKSAQLPFHFWLPNAMAAPTPVSAYLHSATMVKAGVYLLARLSPELGGTEIWIWTLTIAGGLTMLLGAVWSVRQSDLKLALAFTTVSGLGSLAMFLGSRDPVAIVAASTFLIVHALYKASLFLMVGVLDRMAGTRDIERLGGLGRAMPLTWAIALLSGFSMAGFPPLLGFIGKELKYEGALAVASEPIFVAGVAVVSNALMAAVALKLALGPFIGARRADRPAPADAPWPMMIGPAVLALAGLVFGLAPGLLNDTLIQPMARSIVGLYGPGPVGAPLKLWHGLNLPLLLSVATFAIGLAAWFALPRLRALLAALEPRAPQTEVLYDRALSGLKSGAAALTRLVQPAAPARQMAATLTVLAALTLGAALVGGGVGLPAAPHGTALDWALVALIASGAVMTPFTLSRIGAIAALGLVGAGVATLFAVYGALDVAITQLLVETLSVVIVAVALRSLPLLDGAGLPRARRLAAIPVAAAAGLAVTLGLLVVLETPLDRRLTSFYEAASWPEAFGRNVVNVILVDFRALDTLGEMLVVALAGVAALAALGVARRRA